MLTSAGEATRPTNKQRKHLCSTSWRSSAPRLRLRRAMRAWSSSSTSCSAASSLRRSPRALLNEAFSSRPHLPKLRQHHQVIQTGGGFSTLPLWGSLMQRAPHKHDDRGIVLIEFVLIAPILMMLLLGIVEFGQYYNQRVQVTGTGGMAHVHSRWAGPPTPTPAMASPSASQVRPVLPAPIPPSSRVTSPRRRPCPTRSMSPSSRVGDHHRLGSEDAMRRLKLHDDRGSVLILTVLVMVMLMGAVALATDGSALVVAKRSAQNSADAAALALAQDCIRPGGSCQSSPSPYFDPPRAARSRPVPARSPSASTSVSTTRSLPSWGAPATPSPAPPPQGGAP